MGTAGMSNEANRPTDEQCIVNEDWQTNMQAGAWLVGWIENMTGRHMSQENA